MANHGNPEGGSPFDSTSGNPAAGTSDGLAALQKDADLARPPHPASAEKPRTESDWVASLGNESQFLKEEPGRIRKQFGLHDDAGAKELFEKMAKVGYQEYKHSSPDLQRYELKELGLSKDNISAHTIFEAMTAMRARELGVSDRKDYAAIELAMHKKTYADAKAGKLPIDYD